MKTCREVKIWKAGYPRPLREMNVEIEKGMILDGHKGRKQTKNETNVVEEDIDRSLKTSQDYTVFLSSMDFKLKVRISR